MLVPKRDSDVVVFFLNFRMIGEFVRVRLPPCRLLGLFVAESIAYTLAGLRAVDQRAFLAIRST